MNVHLFYDLKKLLAGGCQPSGNLKYGYCMIMGHYISLSTNFQIQVLCFLHPHSV